MTKAETDKIEDRLRKQGFEKIAMLANDLPVIKEAQQVEVKQVKTGNLIINIYFSGSPFTDKLPQRHKIEMLWSKSKIAIIFPDHPLQMKFRNSIKCCSPKAN